MTRRRSGDTSQANQAKADRWSCNLQRTDAPGSGVTIGTDRRSNEVDMQLSCISRPRHAAALLLAAGCLMSLPASAYASHPPDPKTELTLTVVEAGTLSQRNLACQPPGGTHPNPKAACAALAAVDGDIDKLNLSNKQCESDTRSVTATARGVWRGQSVTQSRTFLNRCVLERKTGPVFTWS